MTILYALLAVAAALNAVSAATRAWHARSRLRRAPTTWPHAVSEVDIDTALRAGCRVDAIRMARRKYGYSIKDALIDVAQREARLELPR